MTCFFVFILIVHIHGAVVVTKFVGESRGRGLRLNLDVQGQGGEKISDIDGHRVWGSLGN